MKRSKEDQIIQQALTIAFQEEQRPYERMDAPTLSPDFRARIMALHQTQTEARHKARRAAMQRRWVYATAALLLVCVVGLSAPAIQRLGYRWLRARTDHPEVSYTISQMPTDCTQVYHQTSFHMAYTQWETESSDRIILLQEEASPEALLEGKDYRQKKIHTSEVTGTLYIGADHTALIWKNGKYYFLIVMDGALTDEDLVIRTAGSLVMTRS